MESVAAMAAATAEQTNVAAMDAIGSKAMPARDAVFRTYELLESIIHSLPLQDIMQGAAKVNKAWHEVVTTSIKINKRIVTSPRFITLLKSKKVKGKDVLYRTFFWGSVIIKKDFEHTDIVYVMDG